MKNIEYPPVDYNLCPRPWHCNIKPPFCIHAGLNKDFGKCLHPSAKLGLLHSMICPPIKKYKMDLVALEKKRGKHG